MYTYTTKDPIRAKSSGTWHCCVQIFYCNIYCLLLKFCIFLIVFFAFESLRNLDSDQFLFTKLIWLIDVIMQVKTKMILSLTSFLAAFYNDIITLNVFTIHQGQFCDIDR